MRTVCGSASWLLSTGRRMLTGIVKREAATGSWTMEASSRRAPALSAWTTVTIAPPASTIRAKKIDAGMNECSMSIRLNVLEADLPQQLPNPCADDRPGALHEGVGEADAAGRRDLPQHLDLPLGWSVRRRLHDNEAVHDAEVLKDFRRAVSDEPIRMLETRHQDAPDLAAHRVHRLLRCLAHPPVRVAEQRGDVARHVGPTHLRERPSSMRPDVRDRVAQKTEGGFARNRPVHLAERSDRGLAHAGILVVQERDQIPLEALFRVCVAGDERGAPQTYHGIGMLEQRSEL